MNGYTGIKYKHWLVLFLLVLTPQFYLLNAQEVQHAHRLWYAQPAVHWPEALPLGNGRLGAMVFGGVAEDRIQFNEETLWQGQPTSYVHGGAHRYVDTLRRLLFNGQQAAAQDLAMNHFMSVPLRQKAYQPFGDVRISFPHHLVYEHYRRELVLDEATCRVVYQSRGVNFQREYFISYPDQVMVIRLTADVKRSLDFVVGLDAPHAEKTVTIEDKNKLELRVNVKDGALYGVAQIMVQSDGKLATENNQITEKEASIATLYLTAATNFIRYNNVSGRPEGKNQRVLEALRDVTYQDLQQRHLADFQSLYRRFSISFSGNERRDWSTDRRIRAFDEAPLDADLLALYVQYGRYLLLSSSRSGTQPANLQGIWNADLFPAWDSKWTTNINTEMNYWPAEVTNLPECHFPLFDLIEECAETGRQTAREHYNCPGWVLHHNTDLWRGSAPINHANHGIWVTGGAWLSLHLWEHYLFNPQKDFLATRAYPLMKGAAEFFTKFLIPDPRTGYLISTPSNSPENGGLVAGPTMDHQIIRSLFKACIEASRILEKDREFNNNLETLLGRMAPDQVGRYGQLQEWLEDLDDPANKHRHVSHLWGVFPGKEITWKDSLYMRAAIKSLELRGDEGTGWSLAWKINFWARFLDGERALQLVRLLLRPVEPTTTQRTGTGGSYPNLFDAHPPFQIDGNMGGAAGIVEMLLQSHDQVLHLLPALPTMLPSGQLSGVCGRGGFELQFSWNQGELEEVNILSKSGRPCRVRYKEKVLEFPTLKGQKYRLNRELVFLE